MTMKTKDKMKAAMMALAGYNIERMAGELGISTDELLSLVCAKKAVQRLGGKHEKQ